MLALVFNEPISGNARVCGFFFFNLMYAAGVCFICVCSVRVGYSDVAFRGGLFVGV